MTNSIEKISYRNDIAVNDAWELLQKNDDVILVDVRTSDEWLASGCPDLGDDHNKKLIKCSLDSNFENNLSEQILDKNKKILFICEAGFRSQKAAILMTENGYNECYNVVGGAKAWKSNKLLWTGV
jgi:rhodanese-related sulfurtransferase